MALWKGATRGDWFRLILASASFCRMFRPSLGKELEIGEIEEWSASWGQTSSIGLALGCPTQGHCERQRNCPVNVSEVSARARGCFILRSGHLVQDWASGLNIRMEVYWIFASAPGSSYNWQLFLDWCRETDINTRRPQWWSDLDERPLKNINWDPVGNLSTSDHIRRESSLLDPGGEKIGMHHITW